MIGFSGESDYIVVGGGTAGCVVASRLSELPQCEVMLLEAGPDYYPESTVPRALRELRGVSLAHDWGYASEPEPAAGGRPVRLPRGKLVGGCSRVHLGIGLEPFPAEFDAWADLGLESWRWADVAPFFERVSVGGLPAAPRPSGSWSKTQTAFYESCRRAGFNEVSNVREARPGVVTCPVAATSSVRNNASAGYLPASVRSRPNLRVVSGLTVDSVVPDATRGTQVVADGGVKFRARRGVVLAAGVLGTPSVLARSGIGPARQLEGVGIRTLSNLPAVGAHLQDHPLAIVEFPLNDGSPIGPDFVFDVLLRTLSQETAALPDVHVLSRAVVPRRRDRGPVLRFFVGVMGARSPGSVGVVSASPHDAPSIRLNYLQDAGDVMALRSGMQALRAVVTAPPIADLIGARVHTEEADFPYRLTSYQHAVGTCRMGHDRLLSVVDEHCLVHGSDNLWIADASVIPKIPTVNTMLTTAVIAERCAGFVKESSA